MRKRKVRIRPLSRLIKPTTTRHSRRIQHKGVRPSYGNLLSHKKDLACVQFTWWANIWSPSKIKEVSSLRDNWVIQYYGVAGGSSHAVSEGVSSADRPRFSGGINEH